MEKFTEELNKFTNNEYDFILKSALLDKVADFCVVEILYKDGVMLKTDEKKRIENFALSILPKNFVYEFNFIKRYINEERIFDDTKSYLLKNYPSVSSKIESVELNNNTFSIKITIDELSFEHAKNKNLKENISKYLKSLYDNFEYVIELESGTVFVEDTKQELIKNFHEEQEDIYAKRKIEFFNVVKLIGDFEEGEKADYIKDKIKPENNIIICGKIQNIQEKVIKRKPKEKPLEDTSDAKITEKVVESSENNQEQNKQNQAKSENASSFGNETEINNQSEHTDEEKTDNKSEEVKYQRKLYKFELSDFTGTMNCVFFSNKENQAKIEKLEVGSVIVVRGNLEADAYSGGNTLKVKDLAYCSIPEGLKEYIEYRKEKPFYEFVEPEKIITYSQDNLLSFTEEKHIQNSCKTKCLFVMILKLLGFIMFQVIE